MINDEKIKNSGNNLGVVVLIGRFFSPIPYIISAIVCVAEALDIFAEDLEHVVLGIYKQKANFSNKTLRLLASIIAFALGILIFTAGGFNIPFLTALIRMLGVYSFGSPLIGIIAGGFCFAFIGQILIKQVCRLWRKLSTGLPFTALKNLSNQQLKDYCEQLSIAYLPGDNRFCRFFNKLRIRWASGDTNASMKFWRGNKNDGYIITNKVNTWTEPLGIIGFIAGFIASLFLLSNPISCIIIGFLGYMVAGAIGSIFSYYKIPIDERSIYDKLQEVKFDLATHSFSEYLFRRYYKYIYESSLDKNESKGKAILKSIFFGTCGILIDLLKNIIILFYTIVKNCWNYLSSGKAWKKLRENYQTWRNELKDQPNKAIFVLKTISRLFFLLTTSLLKLPKKICESLLDILNPFANTNFCQEKLLLITKKKLLKNEISTELNVLPQKETATNHLRRPSYPEIETCMASLKKSANPTIDVITSPTKSNLLRFFASTKKNIPAMPSDEDTPLKTAISDEQVLGLQNRST